MPDDRAYLVTIGTLPQRGRRHRRQVTAGRHRAGTGSLRHCREMPSVDHRLPVRLPKPGRLRRFSRAAQCGTPRSSPRQTSAALRWCLPACGTSGTNDCGS